MSKKVAKKSGNYKTDKDGNFHIAKSYGPEKHAEGDRSRTYTQESTLLDPKSKVTMKIRTLPLTNRSKQEIYWKIPLTSTQPF